MRFFVLKRLEGMIAQYIDTRSYLEVRCPGPILAAPKFVSIACFVMPRCSVVPCSSSRYISPTVILFIKLFIFINNGTTAEKPRPLTTARRPACQ